MQQTIFHERFAHIHTVGQNKTALKLPRPDPAMQKHPRVACLLLPPPNKQLAILKRDR